MTLKYSIAEARHNLAALVHDVERRDCIELTRRGQPVAMLLSMRAYRRLIEPQAGFWDAYQSFRKAVGLAELGIQPEEVFGDVRDPSPGRETDW